MITTVRRFYNWLAFTSAICIFSSATLEAQLIDPIGREATSSTTASISDTSRTDQTTSTAGSRWGLHREQAHVKVSKFVDTPIGLVEFSIDSQATSTTYVRPNGIFFATNVEATPPPFDRFTPTSTGFSEGAVHFRILEAFDGYLRFGRIGGSSIAGATMTKSSGEPVWNLVAPEYTVPILWNGQPVGDEPVSLQARFEVGEYTLSYGHRPLVIGGVTGTSSTLFWFVKQGATAINGDFDGDGIQLSEVPEEPFSYFNVDPLFDVNGDLYVSKKDRVAWVEQFAKTYFGDATLDGEFNSEDLVSIFAAGQYQDNVSFNSGWAEGDWDGSGDFDSSDLLLAFQSGGYGRGKRAAVAAIPEPSAPVLISGALIWSAVLRRLRGLET